VPQRLDVLRSHLDLEPRPVVRAHDLGAVQAPYDRLVAHDVV
jgi:hypothetical protein